MWQACFQFSYGFRQATAVHFCHFYHIRKTVNRMCARVCAVSICCGPIWFALIKLKIDWLSILVQFWLFTKANAWLNFWFGCLFVCHMQQGSTPSPHKYMHTMHMLWKQCMRPFIAHAVTLCMCGKVQRNMPEYTQCIAWPNSHVWTWHMQNTGHNLCRWLVATTWMAQHGKFDINTYERRFDEHWSQLRITNQLEW